MQENTQSMSAQDHSFVEELEQENRLLRARNTRLERQYEELRCIIDGGSESMTHEDAVLDLQCLILKANYA